MVDKCREREFCVECDTLLAEDLSCFKYAGYLSKKFKITTTGRFIGTSTSLLTVYVTDSSRNGLQRIITISVPL